MNDPEDNDYYAKRQRKADETAVLYLKLSFWLIMASIGYALGILVGELFRG